MKGLFFTQAEFDRERRRGNRPDRVPRFRNTGARDYGPAPESAAPGQMDSGPQLADWVELAGSGTLPGDAGAQAAGEQLAMDPLRGVAKRDLIDIPGVDSPPNGGSGAGWTNMSVRCGSSSLNHALDIRVVNANTWPRPTTNVDMLNQHGEFANACAWTRETGTGRYPFDRSFLQLFRDAIQGNKAWKPKRRP